MIQCLRNKNFYAEEYSQFPEMNYIQTVEPQYFQT